MELTGAPYNPNFTFRFWDIPFPDPENPEVNLMEGVVEMALYHHFAMVHMIPHFERSGPEWRKGVVGNIDEAKSRNDVLSLVAHRAKLGITPDLELAGTVDQYIDKESGYDYTLYFVSPFAWNQFEQDIEFLLNQYGPFGQMDFITARHRPLVQFLRDIVVMLPPPHSSPLASFGALIPEYTGYIHQFNYEDTTLTAANLSLHMTQNPARTGYWEIDLKQSDDPEDKELYGDKIDAEGRVHLRELFMGRPGSPLQLTHRYFEQSLLADLQHHTIALDRPDYDRIDFLGMHFLDWHVPSQKLHCRLYLRRFHRQDLLVGAWLTFTGIHFHGYTQPEAETALQDLVEEVEAYSWNPLPENAGWVARIGEVH